MQDSMTAAQREAMAKILMLAGEHFNRSVVILEWEPDDLVGGTDMQVHFQGGKWAAVGLLEGAKLLVTGE